MGTTTYTYDGVGNRIRATRGGVTTQYIYDAAGNLLAEANGSGVITRYYIYGKGLAAMVTADGQIYFYHFDGTGHTVAMTNSAKQVVNRYAYSPYGEVLGKQEQVPQPFTYAGQVGIFTEADNLYYMRARYYDAKAGRFISEDPAGFVDGPNLYAYVGGNPVGVVDPTGMVYGYGNGPYSNYNTNAVLAEAASRQDYADASAVLGDAFSLLTPVSGPLAPAMGGVATGFTVMSIALDPAENLASGAASIMVERGAKFLLRRVSGPLDLTENVITGAAAFATTPITLYSIANRAAESRQMPQVPGATGSMRTPGK